MTPTEQYSEFSTKIGMEKPLSAFIGHYVGWVKSDSQLKILDTEDQLPVQNTYGVISINAIDEKARAISLSTLFLGTKIYHRYYYKMDEGKLTVNLDSNRKCDRWVYTKH